MCIRDRIITSLAWLGIKHDGDEYIQSKNISKHVTVAEELLKKGFAYKCYCSEEEINEQKEKCKKQGMPYVYNRKWRDAKDLKIPEGVKPVLRFKSKISGNTIIKDLVQGDRNISNSTIEDFVILRKDNTPTYQLSATVDDHEMKITHVIRGDDHLANTPKQILVYKALGLNTPIFAHLPMILGSDKKRLSKRHAATNVQEYKDKGFTPKVILNYLSLLGWNPDSEKEIFDQNELINSFEFKQVQKKSAVFDEKKLLWISQQHLSEMSVRDLMNEIYTLNPEWGDGLEWDYLKEVVKLIKDRSKTITEITSMSEIFFKDKLEYDIDLLNKTFNDKSIAIIKDFQSALSSIEDWSRVEIEKIFEDIMEQHEVAIGQVMKPVRVAFSCIPFGPWIFDLILFRILILRF